MGSSHSSNKARSHLSTSARPSQGRNGSKCDGPLLGSSAQEVLGSDSKTSANRRRPEEQDRALYADPPPCYQEQAKDSVSGNGSSGNSTRSKLEHVVSTLDCDPRREVIDHQDYLRAPMRRETHEEALETLRNYNTVILVDDSFSMMGSLWREATETLSAVADRAAQFDTDGIDIFFLNAERSGENMKDSDAVARLFDKVRPSGATPLGARLDVLVRKYLSELEAAARNGNADRIKPVNFIVITDGQPTDDPESVIVQIAQRLERGNFPLHQLGIQFVQIGQNRGAKEFLDKLDNALATQYNIRDIVDTTPYFGTLSADALIKILLGGINKRIDRQSNKPSS